MWKPWTLDRRYLYALAASGLLTVVWFLGLADLHFERCGPNLLSADRPYRAAPIGQAAVGPPLRVRGTAEQSIAYCFQTVGLGAGRHYEVSAQWCPQWIEGGVGRLVLLPIDRLDQPFYGEPHVVARCDGSAPWGAVRGRLRVPENVERARAGIDLHAPAGELLAHTLAVHELRERGAAAWVYWLLLVLWGRTLWWAGRALLPRFRLDLAHTVSLVTLVVIFCGMLMPKSMTTAALRAVQPAPAEDYEPMAAPAGETASVARPAAQLRIDRDHAERKTAGLLHKASHFGLFLVLGLALRATGAFRSRRLLWLLLGIAVATECLQIFTATRTPRLSDIGFDMAGAVVGMLLATRVFGWGALGADVAERAASKPATPSLRG